MSQLYAPSHKFYAAGSWNRREEVDVAAKRIVNELGWHCLSRWHRADDDGGLSDNPNIFAREDLAGMERARRIVWFGGSPFSTGKHFELGYALARGWPVHVIRPPWTEKVEKEHCGFIPQGIMMGFNTYLHYAQVDGAYRVDTMFRRQWDRHLEPANEC